MAKNYMRSVLNIFVDSPFVPLEDHAEKGVEASLKLEQMLEDYFEGRDEEVKKTWAEIGKLEHEADLIKQKFRSELPGSYTLQIDKAGLLTFIGYQDLIANCAEDTADFLIIRRGADLPEEVKDGLRAILKKTLDCIRAYNSVIHELEALHATSYGKVEVGQFLCRIPIVEGLEHEIDVMETQLKKTIFEHEDEISGAGVYYLCELTKVISSISDQTTAALGVLVPIILKQM